MDGRRIHHIRFPCETLRHYSQFIELVRYAHDNAEKEHKEHIERPLDWAVKEAVRRDIMPVTLLPQ